MYRLEHFVLRLIKSPDEVCSPLPVVCADGQKTALGPVCVCVCVCVCVGWNSCVTRN
jgi:hypothetical protein